MDLTYSREDESFRADVRGWLEDNLRGDFAGLRGLGGPGREHEAFEERVAWDRHLAASDWTCLGWPSEYGGRGLGLLQQVIFHEEYAKADAPARVSHIGEELLGPTLIAFGTEEQKQRFLPGIRNVTELRCQGYSEPGRAPTWPQCRPGRGWRATSGWWTGRRCGPRRHTCRTGASSWRVPSRGRSATQGCPSCSCRCARAASRCARSSSSPGPRSSTRCSSTGPGPRRPVSSGSPATAGRSPWGPSASSAACRSSGSRSASPASSREWWTWPGRTAP